MTENAGDNGWIEVEGPEGRKVRIPPQLRDTWESLNKGYMRQADYTRKTQDAAKVRDQVLQEKAELADYFAQKRLIDANPMAKAAWDQYIQTGQFPFSGQTQEGPSETDNQFDADPEPQPNHMQRRHQQAMPDYLRQLNNELAAVRQRTTIDNVQTLMATPRYQKPYINQTEVAGYIASHPELHNLPSTALAEHVVLTLYGDHVLSDAQNEGYERAKAEMEQRLAAERVKAEAEALRPTRIVAEDGTVAPGPQDDKAWEELHRKDPAKYNELWNKTIEAYAQAMYSK